MMAGEAGKGSEYRPVDEKRFRDNWDKIFKQPRCQRRYIDCPHRDPYAKYGCKIGDVLCAERNGNANTSANT
jgi:hypothetical protein